MINKEDVIKLYEATISSDIKLKDRWNEALEIFNEKWDFDAKDFKEMYISIFSVIKDIFSIPYYPYNIIKKLLDKDSDAVRELFVCLYDEKIEVGKRIAAFVEGVKELEVKLYNEVRPSNYSYNAITIYLWLRYPNKYYIFRLNEYRYLVRYLIKENTDLKNRAYNNNMVLSYIQCIELYDEIYSILKSRNDNIINSSNNSELGVIELKKIIALMAHKSKKILESEAKDVVKNQCNQNDYSNSTQVINSYNTCKNESYSKYTKEDFLKQAYISDRQYDKLRMLLWKYKCLLIEGAPGVGKTFIAKRLAYSIIGYINPEQVELVTFHPSYSYNEFIRGYTPNDKNFQLDTGVFYDFCKKARNDSSRLYFFVIDEINRGNLNDIFGEMFTFIEYTKRDQVVILPRSKEKFFVPENLYIIGTLNTTGKSINKMDIEFRRRFGFDKILPAFNEEGFKTYQQQINNKKFDKLVKCICELNEAIELDETLGKDYVIGHSYVCNMEVETINIELDMAVNNQIIPLLEEYWFDDKILLDKWSSKLRGAIA